MEITLEQLLGARDARYARQLSLTEEWPDRTLVCLTVVLPGPVKRDAELRDLETGYEGYFLVDGALLDVKKACCEIENEHPYGRLMDLDVLERVGETVVPVSRERVGEQPRRCLLCDRPARECMRAHTHSQAEIFQTIDRILGFDKNP